MWTQKYVPQVHFLCASSLFFMKIYFLWASRLSVCKFSFWGSSVLWQVQFFSNSATTGLWPCDIARRVDLRLSWVAWNIKCCQLDCGGPVPQGTRPQAILAHNGVYKVRSNPGNFVFPVPPFYLPLPVPGLSYPMNNPNPTTCLKNGCNYQVVLRVCRGTTNPQNKGYWYEVVRLRPCQVVSISLPSHYFISVLPQCQEPLTLSSGGVICHARSLHPTLGQPQVLSLLRVSKHSKQSLNGWHQWHRQTSLTIVWGLLSIHPVEDLPSDLQHSQIRHLL